MTWDRALLTWLNRGMAHPALDCLMTAITLSTMPVIAILPIVLWFTRQRRTARALRR